MSPSQLVNKTPELILALDVDTDNQAKYFLDSLYPAVKLFKVGSQLFTAYGPEAVRMVGRYGAKVFLDLKFNDIQRTMFSAIASGTGLSCEPPGIAGAITQDTVDERIEENYKEAMQHPVFMMSVHASASKTDLQGAVRGARDRAAELGISPPYVVGVTVLTSEEEGERTKELVLNRARKVQEAGLDGVVCSVNEAAAVREECGKDFIIVTPGIRLKDSPADDQKRTATAKEAAAAGANYIVVGRPILKAENPRRVAEEIIAECQG
jgi:orotidine-5'-phosphate decarboxylase